MWQRDHNSSDANEMATLPSRTHGRCHCLIDCSLLECKFLKAGDLFVSSLVFSQDLEHRAHCRCSIDICGMNELIATFFFSVESRVIKLPAAKPVDRRGLMRWNWLTSLVKQKNTQTPAQQFGAKAFTLGDLVFSHLHDEVVLIQWCMRCDIWWILSHGG